MSSKIIFDNEKSSTTSKQVEVFPWFRFDAERFLYEEALIDGNYVGVHYSAMGRAGTREKHLEKYTQTDNRYYQNHFFSFELEIDGQLLKNCWKLEDVFEKKLPGNLDESVIVLFCQIRKLKVEIHTMLDGSSFLVRWLNILNEGNEPIAISKIFPWCGIVFSEDDVSIMNHEEYGFQLGRYKNMNWGMEGEFLWENLPDGTLKLESNRIAKFGPAFYVVKNTDTGEMLVINFEYTGGICAEFSNHNILYGRLNKPWKGNYFHARIGLAGSTPYYVLAPGESVSSPRVHLSMLYGDLDTCTNELYIHLRKSVIPQMQRLIKNPLQFNYAGYSKCVQTTEQMILSQMDMAAEIGAELFMVDAGWYGAGDRYYDQVFGDWFENPLLNERLLNCFDYARSKSMMCDMWVAIEILGPSSQIYEEHPDWCMTDGDIQVMMLDILKPEVENYLLDTIINLIERYKLDCFRIDGGPEFFCTWDKCNGRYVENIVWKYYDKLHEIIEKISNRYPELYLENCWGGGGRSDLGMMKRFHWTQITDNWHSEEQLRILNGMTLALPPEQCQVFIGAINMNPADIDFSVRVGLFGQNCIAGLFPSPDKYNEATLDRWKHSIKLYKEYIRPILRSCRVYHHTPLQNYGEKGEWVVLEYVNGDQSSAVVGVFRLGCRDSEYLFLSKGLDISKNYLVRFDNLDGSIVIPGAQLRLSGIRIGISGNMMSELLIIKVVE